MSATPTHDLCVKQGEYIDRNGEQKGRWLTIGTVFRHDDGGTSIKLDCVPVGSPDWNGWVSVFKRKPREEQGQGTGADYQAPQPASRFPNSALHNPGHRSPSSRAPTPPADFDDDIPF